MCGSWERLGLGMKDQNLVSRLLLHSILLDFPIFGIEDWRNGNLGCLVFAYWLVDGFGFILFCFAYKCGYLVLFLFVSVSTLQEKKRRIWVHGRVNSHKWLQHRGLKVRMFLFWRQTGPIGLTFCEDSNAIEVVGILQISIIGL